MFRRYKGQQPQVYPSRKYPPDVFDRFIELANVKAESNRLLLRCYIISLFCAEIPKPISMVHGERGAAKTILQKLKRE